MSERKVLNKYYPPDFDPSKIPRMKLARNRQYTVRLMAPFNMRCKTCGEYIYKGKKFNARKEDVEGDDYLGIRIYRFYIKCTRCLQEISFKTDPKNTDYEIEAGATRNFMALKLAEEQARREEDEEKEEEATNPMKLLEKRTHQSKQELELLESLEELKDLNRRQRSVDYDRMLARYDDEGTRQRAIEEQEKLDEAYVKSIFGKKTELSGMAVEEEMVETMEDDRVSLRESEQPETAVVKQANSSADSRSRISNTTIPSLRTTLSGAIKKKNILGVKTASERVAESNSATVMTTVEKAVDKDGAEKIKKTERTPVSGLSLLCSYSGSSDNESD